MAHPNPLLVLAEPADRAVLAAMQIELDVAAGREMGDVGRPIEGLWFVAAGRIETQRQNEDDHWQPGPLLGPGAFYGSHGLDEGATHSHRLTALTDLRLLAWPAAPLRAAAAASPSLARVLAALRHPGLRVLLPRLAALNPEAARALVALPPEVVEVGPGELAGAPGLLVLDDGSLRDGEALLAPGSLVGATAWLLGVEPLAPARAEGAVRLLVWASVPPIVRSALARLVTADGGRVRGAPGPDPDLSFAPIAEPEPSEYVAEGRQGPLFPPFLRQREEMDCGAACLRMVHAWYGHPLSHRFAMRLARVSRYGTSLLDLARAAEQLGYRATGAKLESAADLAAVDLPAIAHVDGDHFVVVWRVGRRFVTVSDPAHGRLRIGRAAFAERFTGMVLLLRPTDLVGRLEDEEPEARGADFTPRRLWPFIKPLKGLLFHILVASLLLQVLGLAVPFMTQVIIDQVLIHRDVALLHVVLVALITLAVMSGFLLFSRSWLLVHGALQIQRSLLAAIFSRVIQASQRFFARFTSGDLVRRLQEVDTARSFFVDNALQAIIDVLMVATYGAILFFLDGVLAALFAGVLLLMGAGSLLLAWPVRGHMFGFQSRMGRADTHVINALKGIEPIKALALERPFERWYERLLLPGLEHGRRAAHWANGSASFSLLLDGVGVALVLGVGAERVLAGELSLGQLMAFLLLARQLSAPFVRLLGQWRAFQSTVVSLYRLGDLLDEVPEGEQQARRGVALRNVHLRGEIELSGLSFRYQGDAKDSGRNVLENVTLHIRPGERVGIVGRSGCGKSTFARLLLRFYEPTQGTLRFDGIDARDLHPETLRSQIGLVTQEAFLYQASIRDNIACGRDSVTDEDVLRAVEAAGAYEFISELPFGFDTQVGERGLQLSGGQQQRLVIARALCTEPRILVFDEATAALDPVIEAEIHQQLQEVTHGRTTVIIAHRLHTLQHVDRIIVLDRGRVVEQGPHAELMAQGGLYARMWNAAPRWEPSNG